MRPSPTAGVALARIYDAGNSPDDHDIEELFSRNGFVFIGSDPDEWYETVDQVRTLFAAQHAIGLRLRPGAVVAFEDGDMAWAADQTTISVPGGPDVTLRFSTVFAREDDTWKVVHLHASVPVANDTVIGPLVAPGR